MLQEGMRQLSPESVYFRFFTHKEVLTSEELAYFTEVDFIHHVALGIALIEDGREIPLGVGRYIVQKDPAIPKTAEFALAIDEKYQGIGVGTVLFRHLRKIARTNNIEKFIGLVIPENRKMLLLIDHLELPTQRITNRAGILEITIDLI